MKVIGLGIDICKNARMQRILDNPVIKNRFIDKMLNPQEKREDIKAQFLASRWAVKEAVYKAAGNQLLLFPEIIVKKSDDGQPSIEYIGSTKDKLAKKGVTSTWVSISHEDEYSVAVVLLCGIHNPA